MELENVRQKTETPRFEVGETLSQDHKTLGKLKLNLKRNKDQDNTDLMDLASQAFSYEACKTNYWNPERFSLFYGTELWNQSTESQKVKLNQLYWVAYYSQIISAEIATIFFNQTSAAGLYGIEDFRVVCDTLDMESAQERAHINAFKTLSEQFEDEVFGKRLFTYPMRGPYVETILFRNAGKISQLWRWLQLNAFSLLSSQNAFIACQYFTVRGIRTLNGKIIQHQLSQFYAKDPNQLQAPIPSRVSYLHFLDESFHFNSSTIISHDVLKCLKAPTKFECRVANLAIQGAQKDHFHFSSAINGLFWYDPALFQHTLDILTGPIFNMAKKEAHEMMGQIFCQDSNGVQLSYQSKQLAMNSYREYLANITYVSKENKEMSLMAQSTLDNHFSVNRRALAHFIRRSESPNG